MTRILVIQLDRIGDAIQTTPLLQELHMAHPEAEIDLLVAKEAALVLNGMPGLNNMMTLPMDKVAAWSLRIREEVASGTIPDEVMQSLASLDFPFYDKVINVSHSQYSAWLTQRIPAAQRQGGLLNARGEWVFSGPWHNYLMALVSFREANAFNLVDLFRADGETGRVCAQRLFVNVAEDLTFAQPESPYIVLNPGASKTERCWSRQSFAQLADMLWQKGYVPVLMGAPADVEICSEVARLSEYDILNVCGKTSLPEAARLLEGAEALVSNDTGAVHLAAAVDTPVIGLYGFSAFFRETGPWGAGHIILQTDYQKEEASLNPISAQLVLHALLYRLGKSTLKALESHVVKDVSAWQSFFLPQSADPIGGMSYLPLDVSSLSFEQWSAYILRHVLAAQLSHEGEMDLKYFQQKYIEKELFWPENIMMDLEKFNASGDLLDPHLSRLREAVELFMKTVEEENTIELAQLEIQGKAIDDEFQDLDKQSQEFSTQRLIVSHLCWRQRMLPALPLQKSLSYYRDYLIDAQNILQRLMRTMESFAHATGLR